MGKVIEILIGHGNVPEVPILTQRNGVFPVVQMERADRLSLIIVGVRMRQRRCSMEYCWDRS